MPRITPCFRCPLREGCEHRETLRERAANTGAIAITFRCDKLGAEMRPGRRVEITHPFVQSGTYFDPDLRIGKRKVPATITTVRSGYQFASLIDPGVIDEEENEGQTRFRKTQRHYRIIRFLDEPDLPLCKYGNLQRDGQCQTSSGCACIASDLDRDRY